MAEFEFQELRPVTEIEEPEGLLRVLERAVDWIFTLLLILAVIMVLWAAFKYLTAGGDAKAIQQANSMLLWAAVAVAVAVLSRSIPILVRTFVEDGFEGGGGGGVPAPPPRGRGGFLNV